MGARAATQEATESALCSPGSCPTSEFAVVAAVVKGGVTAKDAAAVGGLLSVLLVLLVLLALLVRPVKVAVKVIVKVVVEVVPARLVRVGGGGEGACVRARKDDVLWRGGGGRIHRACDFLFFVFSRARAARALCQHQLYL